MGREPRDFREPKTVLMEWWRETLIVAAFLTRLPVFRHERREADEEDADEVIVPEGDLATASRTFPLVGFAVGLLGAAVLVLAKWIGLGPFLAAVFAIAAVIIVTGGLHEDGLADTAEGFIAGRDPEAKLAIMRDTRMGGLAVLALVFSVLLRVGALASIAGTFAAAAALIAAATFSRAVLPAVMAWFEPARLQGLAVTAGKPPKDRVVVSILIGVVFVFIFMGPLSGLFALVVGTAAAGAVAALAQREVGGYTGDILGAIQQLTEIAILLAAAMLA